MNKTMFLVMEEDLISRFSFFTNYTQMPVHILRLKASFDLSKLKTIASRLNYSKKLDLEYHELKTKLGTLDKIFISNPEGFIAKNIIYRIRRDYPRLEIISMQHGVFTLGKISFFSNFPKAIINFFSKVFLGYFLVGDGFGDKTTDKYIVYNSLYKNYLIEHGWKTNEVIVSSFFLKGYEAIEPIETKPNDTAIFFLQCLHSLGSTDKNTEIDMISTIVQKLSVKFRRVLIKQHPYADVELPPLPDNVEVIKVVPDIKNISFVISAFSTALFEYERHGIPYTSIYSEKLKVDKILYEQFLYVHDFDHEDKELTITHNKKRLSVPVFFEVGETSLESL
jgi:hypothetical protein